MKLKNILIPFAGVLLLTACEKDHRNDNLTDPRVYIVNNGVQNAIYYDVEETIDYNIYAYSTVLSFIPTISQCLTSGC